MPSNAFFNHDITLIRNTEHILWQHPKPPSVNKMIGLLEFSIL